MVDVGNFKTIEHNCSKCKGECWSKDQRARQQIVIRRFGKIPNSCVDDENGTSHCPYSQK